MDQAIMRRDQGGLSMPTPEIMREGGTLQKTETGYTTAVSVQRPRQIARVEVNILREAKSAGDEFIYSWDQGGKTILGGSVHLAMSIAREWGNCAIPPVKVEEYDTHYIFHATFVDLESGFTVSRAYKQDKGRKIGGYDQGRKEDILFQIGQSKAIRNVVFNAVPKWLVDKAVRVAIGKEEAQAAKNPEQIKAALEEAFLTDFDISRKALEAKVGKPMQHWTERHIVELRAVYRSLRDGVSTKNELFPEQETPKKSPVGEAAEVSPAKSPEPKQDAASESPTEDPPAPKKDLFPEARDYPDEQKAEWPTHGLTDDHKQKAREVLGKQKNIPYWLESTVGAEALRDAVERRGYGMEWGPRLQQKLSTYDYWALYLEAR